MNFLDFKQNEKQNKGFQTARFETLKFLGLALWLWCSVGWAGDLLEVEIESEEHLELLQHLAPDIEIINENKVLLYADKRLQQVLKHRDFKFSIKIINLEDYYARRAHADLKRRTAKPAGSMGGYRTFAEIEQTLDLLEKTYPQLISKFSIGKTHEGRDIWALKITANPTTKPSVWFDALHHAREPLTAEILLRLVDKLATQYYAHDPDINRMLQTRTLLVVPCVNPDGYEYNRQLHPQGGGMWRKNRRPNLDGSYGVDLNRNYGWKWGTVVDENSTMSSELYQGVSAFSEPETRALRDLMTLEKPRFAVTMHSYGNEWMFPWGYTDEPTDRDSLFRYYGYHLAEKTGYVVENAWHLYGATSGTTDDFLYANFGTFAYTLEVGTHTDGFWAAPSRIDPIFNDLYPALTRVIQWAGALPLITPKWHEIMGNGDSAFDAGEMWGLQLSIFNEGTSSLDGTLRLHPRSSGLSLDNSEFFLNIAPRAHWSSAPIILYISPFTQHLELIDLFWNFEGFESTQPLKIPLGKSRVIAWDDMEVADFGWKISNPQPKWTWQRTVPAFASSDTTPASKGWVTTSELPHYNAQGLTMLTSPRFNALGLDNLELSYRRWLGASKDDRLEVHLSNDDGVTWHTLERISHRRFWEQVHFTLDEVLPLTDRMRLRFVVQDAMNDDLTDVCIDDIVLRSRSSLPTLGVWGKVAQGEWVRVVVDGSPYATVQVYASFQSEYPYFLPNSAGQAVLSGHIFPLWNARTNDHGQASWLLQCPDLREFLGYRVYLQALLKNADHTFEISRPTAFTFE